MPRISSPRPLDLTKPFVTSSQSYGSQPVNLSQNLVTWYRDIKGDFVPDLSGRGNTARCAGSGSHDRVEGSNDIPEFNPLNYPLSSFDLTDNAGSTSNVRHIRTINSSGRTIALDDHSFTDDAQDLPFSLSFWLKLDSTDSTQYIVTKTALASGNYEWSVIIDVNARLTFRLYSGGESSPYIQAYESSAFTALHNGWDHFVLTYDGSGTPSGINIYRNGSDVSPIKGGSSTSSYASMIKTSIPLCLGAILSTSLVPQATDLRGKIHSFAVWKNREINSAEALALYYAYLNGPGGEVRSGFTSKSPRLQLRELDDHPGSYPTILRTGDATRTGNLRTNFDDETTIVFSQSGETVFPAMLPKGSSFLSQAVDILGQESDISASLPVRSFQQPTHLHYSPVENTGPFDENRTIPSTDAYLSGTDPNILPGFTSPIRSKVAIDIDITPQSDTLVMRNVDRRTIAEGGASIGDKTGFLYYNFSRREWEQIGLIDPATKTSRYFDYAIQSTAGNVSGTFPYQFCHSPGSPFVEKASVFVGITKEALGYSKIGSPSLVMGAPNFPLYHATQSQALKMSDYINAPFLLEAIEFSFGEVNAQRIQGDTISTLSSDPGVTGFSKASDLVLSGALRDIDNYVFFGYKQSHKNRVIDSVADVSSSERTLIFSSSLTFWNSASLGTGDSSSLMHSPTFNYEFGLPFSSDYAVGNFTGSISAVVYPGVNSPGFLGLSQALRTTARSATAPTVSILNSWPGGTSYRNFTAINPDKAIGYDFMTDLNVSQLASDYGYYDPRATRKFGGENQTPILTSEAYGLKNSPDAQSNVSPYLLMPDDEIILGFEAGIGAYAYQQSFSTLTGSFLRIKSSPCRIRLFGSLIKNDEENTLLLNQNLSSDSIHELIGAEPVLDQFQIEPASSYYGSYLDNVVTGSMVAPVLGGLFFVTASQDQSRRIVSRVSVGQAGTTGSFQRFSAAIDPQSTIFDSCLPDYTTMIQVAPTASQYTYLGESVPRFAVVANQIYETSLASSKVKQFPFEGNPTRRVKKNSAIVNVNVGSGVTDDRISDPVDVTGEEVDSLNVVYKTGYAFVSRYNVGSPPDLTVPFYTAETLRRADLSQNLASSYYYDTDAWSYGEIRDQTQSGPANTLALIPGPELEVGVSTDVPYSRGPRTQWGEKSFVFDAASTSADVQYAVASDDWDDHKMSSGGVDLPFTLSIAFKSTTNAANALIQRAYYSTVNPDLIEYELSLDSNRKANFKIYYNNTTNYKSVVSVAAVPVNEWVHLVATYDGLGSTGPDHMRLYMNGEEMDVLGASVSPGSAMTVSSNSRLSIGAKLQGDMDPSSSNELVGYFHSCNIWKNRELTATEVNDLYYGEFIGTTRGIVKHRADDDITDLTSDLKIKPGAYRYGISNVNQENLKINFLPDRYGQFRHIIEQSKDTALVDRSPPVKIKFISGSTIVDPMLTYSQNLSTFATSSVPYFEGAAKNRPDNPDESLVEVVA